MVSTDISPIVSHTKKALDGAPFKLLKRKARTRMQADAATS